MGLFALLAFPIVIGGVWGLLAVVLVVAILVLALVISDLHR